MLVSDETELVKNMASDNRIALLSFTGSTEAGRIVNELVAKRLGKSILELSGNNGAIIDKGTDLSRVLSAVAFSAMGTAGQRCTTLRRLFVHESDYEKCIDKLIPIYKQIKIGDPLNKKNLVGPLIDKSAVAAFEKTIVIAKQSGGKILSGGKALKHPGYFVEPTLIKINHDCDCVQQETFAPILYIMTYQTFEEAILLHNASCYGLSSALFTNDLAHAEWFLSARGSDCGIANINIGTSGAEIGGAF
ncbi:MAG: aldehyde dehydrogenase, partial [uncultured bacterium]